MTLTMHGGPFDGRVIDALEGEATWLHDNVYEVRQEDPPRLVGRFAFLGNSATWVHEKQTEDG